MSLRDKTKQYGTEMRGNALWDGVKGLCYLIGLGVITLYVWLFVKHPEYLPGFGALVGLLALLLAGVGLGLCIALFRRKPAPTVAERLEDEDGPEVARVRAIAATEARETATAFILLERELTGRVERELRAELAHVREEMSGKPQPSNAAAASIVDIGPEEQTLLVLMVQRGDLARLRDNGMSPRFVYAGGKGLAQENDPSFALKYCIALDNLERMGFASAEATSHEETEYRLTASGRKLALATLTQASANS